MWLLLLIGAVAAYLLLKLVWLLVGDTDLVVRSLKMKPEYFQGRVIWVTGASSGSKSCSTTMLNHFWAGKGYLSRVEGHSTTAVGPI